MDLKNQSNNQTKNSKQMQDTYFVRLNQRTFPKSKKQKQFISLTKKLNTSTICNRVNNCNNHNQPTTQKNLDNMSTYMDHNFIIICNLSLSLLLERALRLHITCTYDCISHTIHLPLLQKRECAYFESSAIDTEANKLSC